MIDIYEIYADIRSYWHDCGKITPHTRKWVHQFYAFTSVQFHNDIE